MKGNINSELWDLVLGDYTPYEEKEEMIYRAKEAIASEDISKLYGPATIYYLEVFHETKKVYLTAENVAHYMAASGIEDFVQRKIEELKEQRLEEIVLGKYGYYGVEVFVVERAKRAIRMCDITPLKLGINIPCPDKTKYRMTGEEMEKKAHEIGLWDFVEKEIEKSQNNK